MLWAVLAIVVVSAIGMGTPMVIVLIDDLKNPIPGHNEDGSVNGP